MRGSSCWTDKTCLYYHFETQPIPSPLSFAYHFAPASVHRAMVNTDLTVQLYTAWFVLFPACTALWLPTAVERVVRFTVRLGGFLQAGFMVGILLSGNFSVLNHLTIIPALACLDDACWPGFLQRRAMKLSEREDISDNQETSHATTSNNDKIPVSRRIVDALLLCLVLTLSRPVIDNLFQRGDHRRQVMNASFDSFRLVNTYGAFGSVGKARYEAIVQISDDGTQWRELEFPCKPGNVFRRPCFCAPYHYRIDWNIWFLGFKPHQNYLRSRETWMFAFLAKLLEADDVDKNDDDDGKRRPWLSLLDPTTANYLTTTYYNEKKAPRYAKVDMYHYQMASPLWNIVWQKVLAFTSGDTERARAIAWWKREFEESLVRPVSSEDFNKKATH